MVSRGAGRSAVAAAAYLSWFPDAQRLRRGAARLHPQTGPWVAAVFLPATAPAEWQDRETLWNAVEETETAKDSRLAREFVAALPIELSREEQIQLLQDFIKEQFVADGMCADAAIHDPYPPGHNPHAHILLTVRPLDEKGKMAVQERERISLCQRCGEERGFNRRRVQTGAGRRLGETVPVQGRQKEGVYGPVRSARRRIMNGYPSIPKVPNMADRIPSRNAGTAMSNLFCGGLHGQLWQTAIWSAPDMRNASTTAAMPSVVCWSGPRSMRVWLPEPWRKRVSSLTGAS